MTDLVFRVLLKGDGSGLVGTTRLSAEEVKKLKDAMGGAEKATEKLNQSTQQLSATEAKAAQASAQLQAAQARSQTAALALAKAQDAVSAATGKSAADQAAAAAKLAIAQARVSTSSAAISSAQQRLAQLTDRGSTSVTRQQYAMRNLGYQIGDVGTQLASGSSPFLIFAQQATQVTGAMADMGGKVGRLGTALSGPFGAAFITVTALAGVFGSKLLESGEAAKAAEQGSSGLAQAQSTLGEIFDLTSGKIKSQNALLIANARLMAINLRAEAEKARKSANDALTSTAQPGFLAMAGAHLRGAFVEQDEAGYVTRLQGRSALASSYLAAIRDARTDADRQKAGERALGFSQRGDFSGLSVTKEEFRQAVIDMLSATAKEMTADAIDKSLNSGSLAPSLRRDAKTPKPKSLDNTLGSTLKDLDPLASIQHEYQERLKNIEKLAKAKKISDAKADELRLEAERKMRDERIKLDDQVAKAYQDGLDKASSQAFKDMVNGPIKLVGQSLEQQGEMIAKGVAKSLERTLPIVQNAFGKVLSSFGAGNRLSSIGERLFGGKTFDIGFGSFKSELKTTFKEIFALDGEFGKLFKGLGETLGQLGAAASLGVQIGGLVGGGTGGKIGGALGSIFGKEAGKLIGPALSKAVGGTFGKLLGGAAGPLGAIAGGLLGSVVGGLFSGTKKGTATLGNVNGSAEIVGTGGNSASRISNAKKLGGGVTDALQSIIDQLGGSLGDFSVSIGQRNKKFVVDPTGSGRTKGAGTTKYVDQEEAAMAALADAIADGAVQGLSAAVTKALKSSTDVDKAVKEALKVQQVEELLGGLGAQMQSEFKNFEKQAAERVRIAKQYGFDLVKLEEVNAKERADTFDRVLNSRIEPLKALLNDMSFGELSEGSAVDRRNALLAQVAKAKTDAEAGVDGASSTYADLRRQLLELDRQYFGTAGAEYTGDRAATQTELEAIIKLETERAKEAQKAAQEALQAAKDTASGVDETNDLLAKQYSTLQELLAAFVSSKGLAPSSGAFAYRAAT
ncbi:hypothetical protein HY78_00505 [Rhizorhabdus wittichii DC-6]|nr:hypothetical protein HY78_00505 [Rhizorhabdus wittichii DC-6]